MKIFAIGDSGHILTTFQMKKAFFRESFQSKFTMRELTSVRLLYIQRILKHLSFSLSGFYSCGTNINDLKRSNQKTHGSFTKLTSAAPVSRTCWRIDLRSWADLRVKCAQAQKDISRPVIGWAIADTPTHTPLGRNDCLKRIHRGGYSLCNFFQIVMD